MDRPRRLGPLLLGLLVTLAGCQGPAAPAAPTAPAASPAPGTPAAAGATQVPARVTVNLGIVAPSALLWPLYVTEDAGFADRAGVDIETTITNSASDGMNAMLGGSLDVNALGADAVILAQAHGADVIGVAGLTNRPPYSLLVQPEITQVEDLRGKTLGASSLKTGEVVFLRALLQRYGLGEGDYDVVVAGGSRTRVSAMLTHQVDGTLMPPPDSYRLEDAGMRRLAETTEALPDYQFQLLVTTRQWAQAHAPTLERFLGAYTQAIAWLYDPANRDQATSILQNRMQLSEDYAQRTYAQWIEQEQPFARGGEPTMPGLKATEDLLLSSGEATAPLPAQDRYLDLHYLEAATRQ
ncbi:MAG TPA: ABC transporter substrate-binding protein [Chloroflexota bacterium]|nr:ABC transporter substrate-binding protein [Chloroflexota bacterium]